MAKVIRPFKGCPDGSSRVKQFNPGDEVTGDLERVAVEQKWAVPSGKGAAPANPKVAEGDKGAGAGDGAGGKDSASSKAGSKDKGKGK